MRVAQSTLRSWQFEIMRKSLRIVGDIVNATSSADATTYRDGGTGWTATEIMCHLRDSETLFLERARLTLEQDGSPQPSGSNDQIALDRRYNQQSLQVAYREWVAQREVFLAFLEGLNEAEWTTNHSVHVRRGPMTLSDQLALTAWHDVNHIEQMTRTLAEKLTR